QLLGEVLNAATVETDCEPIVTIKDLGRNLAADGKTILKDTDVANPCGLIAKSFFNDTYSITYNNEEVKINSTGIAWDADKSLKFKRPENDADQIQWIDTTNEHFIVWMRPA